MTDFADKREGCWVLTAIIEKIPGVAEVWNGPRTDRPPKGMFDAAIFALEKTEAGWDALIKILSAASPGFFVVAGRDEKDRPCGVVRGDATADPVAMAARLTGCAVEAAA